jgi:hypothetical protein
VSAIDTPPRLPLSDVPAGEFESAQPSHRLARRVFAFTIAAGVVTYLAAARRLDISMIELLFVSPLACVSVAAVGYAVRRARLRIDPDGIRWGWQLLGFRMGIARLDAVTAYRDAVAFNPRRGSVWYVSARDWHEFERVVHALRAAGLPFTEVSERAPLTARLQSYGVVLDGLLWADAVVAACALLAALIV